MVSLKERKDDYRLAGVSRLKVRERRRMWWGQALFTSATQPWRGLPSAARSRMLQRLRSPILSHQVWKSRKHAKRENMREFASSNSPTGGRQNSKNIGPSTIIR